MKKSLLVSALLFFALSFSAFSQIGIGIGSAGLNIRTDPDSKRGLILRTGFGLTANPLETYIKPEAAWVRRHHYSDKTILYAGIGATGELTMSMQELNIGYGLLIPVGLELFPMSSRKLSVSLETGLRFQGFGEPEAKLGNYGLLEITFYLNQDNED